MNDDMAQVPECVHVWHMAHQVDFPEEVFWVSVCEICLEIDGDALTRQIKAHMNHTQLDRAIEERDAAVADARSVRNFMRLNATKGDW